MGTEVHFSSRTFSSLTEGECSYFFSSSSYTTAKAAHKVAVAAYTKAVGEAKQASKSLKLAIEAAAKEKKECECKVKSDHETTFAKHSSSNPANQKAWMFACKVECVLDKKNTCTCDAAPMCKRPKVAPAVMEADCTKIAPAPHHAPAPAPHHAPAPAPHHAPAPAPAPVVAKKVCSKDTGGTCAFFSCHKSRGAKCVDDKCVCGAGQCAVNGKCQ